MNGLACRSDVYLFSDGDLGISAMGIVTDAAGVRRNRIEPCISTCT